MVNPSHARHAKASRSLLEMQWEGMKMFVKMSCFIFYISLLLYAQWAMLLMEVRKLSKSSNLYVRVEPSVKEDAESILSQLGIPMSNAIGIFLKQVIICRGLPFQVTLPAPRQLDISTLTEDDLSAELDKGYSDIANGNVLPAKEAFASLRGELGI